jgi:hypothetical protein
MNIDFDALKLEAVRNFRNQLLKNSDWIVLPDSPVSLDKRQEWIVYRQYLRDLPENIDLSGNVWTDEIMQSKILPPP